VVVFEILPHVMPTLDPDVAVSVEEELTRNGVELHLGEKVVELAGGGKVEKVVTDKGEYRVDAVFVATGVVPETELAKQLGVKLGATGAVQVSKRMETSVENVYAAGDAAEATGSPSRPWRTRWATWPAPTRQA